MLRILFNFLFKIINFNDYNYLLPLSQWSSSLKGRIIFIALSFFVIFFLIALRIIEISTHSSEYFSFNDNKTLKHRKKIIDRNNNVLAINLFAPSVFVNPEKIINAEQAVKGLKTVLTDIDEKKLLDDLNSDKKFVWVKRHLTPKEHEKVYNLGIPGLEFQKEYKRVYTYGNLLSHIIGYVGVDMQGLSGLEKSFHGFLTNSDLYLKQDEFDKPLVLSIDVRVQNIVNEELESAIKEFNAIGGVGIVADPNNGEILALVSKPDFDPHYPAKATSEQLFNKGSLGVYEFGSVLKTLTMAIGFDTKTTTMNDLYDLTNLKVSNFQIKDVKKREGWHSIAEIFCHSSNVGVVQIALEVGKDNFKKYLKLLGLTEQLKIELPEKATPLYPAENNWSDLSTATISYGYALSISPLHFLQAMIPIVNGGYLYPITLIKREKNNYPVPKKVFDSNTSKEVNTLLRLGVKYGTSKKADIPGYLVGGKSGTAEKVKGKKYDKNSRRSSFFGIFPSIKPQYIVYLMLDNPKGNKSTHGFATAGWTTVPAAGRIISRIGILYGIQPYEEINNIKDIKIDNKTQDEI